MIELKVTIKQKPSFKIWLMKAKFRALMLGVEPSDEEIKAAVDDGIDVFIGKIKC